MDKIICYKHNVSMPTLGCYILDTPRHCPMCAAENQKIVGGKMKGISKLHINQAAMCEAVQLWLQAAIMLPPYPVVTSVTNDIDGMFIIKLSAPEEG